MMSRSNKKSMPPAREDPRRAYSRPRRSIALGAAAFLAAAAAGFACGGLAARMLRTGGVAGPGAAGGKTAPGGPSAAKGPSEPPAAIPVFTDVAAKAGIRFRHETGATGKFYLPEVMGAGCAFFDCDGDGDLDIYFANGNRLPLSGISKEITGALYRNDGGGKFTEVTAAAGLAVPYYGQGCCAGDYDADGDEDLYLTNFGPNALYRNEGGGKFADVTAAAGVGDPGWGQSCAFFDADGDGDLDLYAQNYLDHSIEGQEKWYITIEGRQVLDYCGPAGYRGQQDRLFRNDGDGKFTDITAGCGIVAAEGTGMGLVCADFDSDGDQDVFISNDSRANFYFRNDGKGKFVECALALGLAYNADGGAEAFMGADAGDSDGDGLLDIAVPTLRSQGFCLFRNLGTMFADASVAAGVDAATSAVTGFAPVFLDYDSDGDLDLFFTCGEVRMGRTEAVAGGTFEERYAMRSLLLENRDGRFVDVSALAGPFFQSRCIGRACSAGDYDDDGDLDLLVTTMGGEAHLLRNDTRGGHWIGFRLLGKPPNRDAVGARLVLVSGGRSQVREVIAGGSYLGQRDRRQLFGLGGLSKVEELRVRWPGGREVAYGDLEIDRYHTLREEGHTLREEGHTLREEGQAPREGAR